MAYILSGSLGRGFCLICLLYAVFSAFCFLQMLMKGVKTLRVLAAGKSWRSE